MDSIQYNNCLNILSKLFSRPIHKLFLGSPEFPCDMKIEKPTTLQVIKTKLYAGLYEEATDFAKDVRHLLTYFASPASTDPIYRVAAQQLLDEFNADFGSKFKSKDLRSIKLIILSNDFHEYLKHHKFTKNFPTEVDGKPHALCLQQNYTEISDKQLIREIKFLHSPDLLMRVASFVYQLQPDAIIMDSNISIKFETISEGKLIEIKKFVHTLLIDAAKGKYDPYKQQIGTFG